MRMLDFRFHKRESGGLTLSRRDKTCHFVDPHPVDSGRRNFLIRCSQGASAALIPASLRDLAFSLDPHNAPPGEFHLHPHYRSQTPIDAALLKVKAGLDDFITEKYADQIGAILAEWGQGLIQSPQDVKAVARVFTPSFLGFSQRPRDSRLVRPGPAVEAHQIKFARQPSLGRDAFVQELRSDLGTFSKILTAEFQVTSINAGALSPAAVQSP